MNPVQSLVVANWIDGFYNRVRRHSYCHGRSPIDYETVLAETQRDAA